MTKRRSGWCTFRSLSIAASCFLVVVSPVFASGQSVASAVRSRYAALQNAALQHDAAALSRIVAPDFQEQDPDGNINAREAYIKQLTANKSGLTVSACTFAVTKLTTYGHETQAWTTYTYIGTYAFNGVAKPFKMVMHTTDLWMLNSGAWKLERSTIHSLTSYLGGKVVQDEREQIAPTAAAIAELRARAIIVPTLRLDADQNQFAPIGAAIGTARIVGMGEGSHGSSEFFAFKNRLFKYLVESKGFTVLAMEAPWGAGLTVDRYIKTGRGNAEQAVASLGFWTWNTPEVVDLIQWMRDYNAAPGKHPILSFIGIDMQDPMGAIGYLAQYLDLHDPAEMLAAHSAFQCSVTAVAEPRVKPKDDCRREIASISQQLNETKNTPDFAIAQQAVTAILQYLDWNSEPRNDMTQTRDEDMAKNVEWVAANYPDAKFALWAHNGHVGTTPELSYRPMGSYLREAFGSNYYAIGQTFGGGTVRAIIMGRGVQTVTVPLSPGDTLARLFAPLDGTVFLDLRELPAQGALTDFFSTPHDIEEIGAVVDPLHPDQKLAVVIPHSFDGLAYVPTTTATVSEAATSGMQRDIEEDSAYWEVAGIGLDDLTISATSTAATVTNDDGLNATPVTLQRRFDASPYIGKSVHITGEVRSHDLLGFIVPTADAKRRDDSVVARSQGSVIYTTKDSDWVPISLTLDVPEKASFVSAGFRAEGLGSIEVRDLRIDTSAGQGSASDHSSPSSCKISHYCGREAS